MDRYKIIVVALFFCILLAMRIQAKTDADSSARKKAVAPTIALTGLEVSKKIFELHYHIKNNSEHDIWICDDIDADDRIHEEEVYLDEDGQTIMIRKRFDVPLPINIGRNMLLGRYVRLQSGEDRNESLFLPLPVYPHPVFYGGPQTQDLEYATRMALEIGYYTGDLPGMIRNILREEEKLSKNRVEDNQAITENYYGGLFYFNEYYKGMRHRDEQVLIDHPPYKALKSEQILLIRVDGLRIPYREKRAWPKPSPPDLSNCTRIEIQYNPSILDYFFPYVAERNLLSLEETQHLKSIKTIVLDDQERIKDLAHEVSLGIHTGGIVNERSMAHVVPYHGSERLKSFNIYNDTSLVTEEKNRFRFYKGLTSLWKLTTQIRPFELREQCSINLRDLWNRLHSYYMIETIEIAYPVPTEWCDIIVHAYQKISKNEKYVKGPFKCPSAGQGKCHYAMNPNCRPGSPPDIVLLFETKAGWNQHGGPELFTFDNHDPKGGCVLLNDGSVKFIRTKDELNRLRWK